MKTNLPHNCFVLLAVVIVAGLGTAQAAAPCSRTPIQMTIDSAYTAASGVITNSNVWADKMAGAVTGTPYVDGQEGVVAYIGCSGDANVSMMRSTRYYNVLVSGNSLSGNLLYYNNFTPTWATGTIRATYVMVQSLFPPATMLCEGHKCGPGDFYQFTTRGNLTLEAPDNKTALVRFSGKLTITDPPGDVADTPVGAWVNWQENFPSTTAVLQVTHPAGSSPEMWIVTPVCKLQNGACAPYVGTLIRGVKTMTNSGQYNMPFQLVFTVK